MSLVSVNSNTHPEFVGIPALIKRHADQVVQFELWVTGSNWHAFHGNHYDWWAFPINKPSSHGFAYSVFGEEIAQMKEDESSMKRHRMGADLLLLSWGWHSEFGQPIANPESGQAWANWPIRLAKCAHSMWLFGQLKQFESCVAYAQYLQGSGTSFGYTGRDLFDEIVNPQNY